MGEFDTLISSIRSEWNKAEKAIKQAEFIDGEVVNPAIFELRYAGRRLIEALDCKESDPQQSIALLRDSLFDCHRARHDAIDAGTAKMVGDLDAAIEFLGADIVMANFTDFSEYFGLLTEVRSLISESREDRQARDKIYAVIEIERFDRLVQLCGHFRACEPMIINAAEKRQAEREEIQQALESAQDDRDAAQNDRDKAVFHTKLGYGLAVAFFLLSAALAFFA